MELERDQGGFLARPDGEAEGHDGGLRGAGEWGGQLQPGRGLHARETGTHVAEGPLPAVSLAELAPDPGDSDGLVAMVGHAHVEQVRVDAVVDRAERVRVGELDQGLDVGRGDGGAEGERDGEREWGWMDGYGWGRGRRGREGQR